MTGSNDDNLTSNGDYPSDRANEPQSDLRGLAAYHAANEWLDTGDDTVTHRPAVAGCSCPMPEPLTLAYCLAQAAWWIQRAAEIGAAAVEAAPEIETSEYWRGRAEEAERMIRAGEIKGMNIDEDQVIV